MAVAMLPVIRVAGRAGGRRPAPICNELAVVPLVVLAMQPGAAPAAGERLPVIRGAGRTGAPGGADIDAPRSPW